MTDDGETSSLRILVQKLESELKEAEKNLLEVTILVDTLTRDVFNLRLDRDGAQKRVDVLEARLAKG